MANSLPTIKLGKCPKGEN